MSPDIDELVRSSMHRHADDAPTVVDLDVVRARSQVLVRRERFGVLGAAAAVFAVLMGIGFFAGHLRPDATPPVAPTPSPTSTTEGPDGLPWLAFNQMDKAQDPSGSLVVRIDGTTRTIDTAMSKYGGPVGWYGADRRTLLYTRSFSDVMAVTFAPDGTQLGAPARLRVPGYGVVTGVSIADGSASGPLVLEANTGDAEFIIVSDDLRSARTLRLPDYPVFVTSSVAWLTKDGRHVDVVSLESGKVTSSFVLPAAPCAARRTAKSLDGARTARLCQDGTWELAGPDGSLDSGLPGPPNATVEGGVDSLWFDPSGRVHVSTIPSQGPADTTQVDDYDWNGVSWIASGHGVLKRVYPSPSTPIEFRQIGRYLVDSPHVVATAQQEIDLGATRAAHVEWRPSATGS